MKGQQSITDDRDTQRNARTKTKKQNQGDADREPEEQTQGEWDGYRDRDRENVDKNDRVPGQIFREKRKERKGKEMNGRNSR